MNNQIQIFTNELFGNVRVSTINNNPYFCLNDVMIVLDMNPNNSKDIKERFDNFINTISTNNYQTLPGIIDPPGVNYLYTYIPTQVQTGIKADGSPAMQTVNMLFISEPALYMVIFQSRKPNAALFQWWVYSEVLPAMRKIGFSQADLILQNRVRELEEENIRLHNKDFTVGVDHAFVSAQYCQMREKLEHLVNNNIPIDKSNIEFIERFDEEWGG